MNSIFKLFRKPTLEERKAKERADAEHLLLDAHTTKEYAESVISYNQARLARLTSQTT